MKMVILWELSQWGKRTKLATGLNILSMLKVVLIAYGEIKQNYRPVIISFTEKLTYSQLVCDENVFSENACGKDVYDKTTEHMPS